MTFKISSEKFMKNDELLLPRGGYDEDDNWGVSCSQNSESVK